MKRAFFLCVCSMCLLTCVAVQPVSGQQPTVLSVKNVTDSIDKCEISPTFVNHGRQVLFLIFDGDEMQPRLWDYRLAISNRDGGSTEVLTGKGVIDYVVKDSGNQVYFLLYTGNVDSPPEDTGNPDIRKWAIYRLALDTRKIAFVEASGDRPLLQGLEALGVAKIYDATAQQMIYPSPFGDTKVILKRTNENGTPELIYSLGHARDAATSFYTTDAWQTHGHYAWFPPVVWLDDENILTLRFAKSQHLRFPQKQGVFSIVKVNLSTGVASPILTDAFIDPFTSLSVNSTAEAVYFQRRSFDDRYSELWAVNPSTGETGRLYWLSGQLSGCQLSSDGSSILFTQLLEGNFDIVRLDLNTNNRLRLAGN